MRDYLLSTGPLTTVVDASNWAFYNGQGIFMNCPQIPHLNHAVQIVGVNLEDPWNSYWIVRSSWGSDFGASGHIYLPYMRNACGLASYPTFTKPVSVAKSLTIAPTTPPSAMPNAEVPSTSPSPAPSLAPPSASPTELPSSFPSAAPTSTASVAPS
eukprot:gene28648-36954_t